MFIYIPGTLYSIYNTVYTIHIHNNFIQYTVYIYIYLIVESISFVLLWDVSLINPKKKIEIINSRDVSV